MLEVQNIYKNYGDHKALQNVSIKVPKGSIYGLLGPNGAGKTSLIRIVNQITNQDSGTVLLDGEILAPKHISQIGYMPEERGLYKSMKVGEQVVYLARLKGLSKQEATQKLKYWFDKFEIGDWWDKKIQELSKGMAQKVQFIVTVLHSPKLLIFDEPFSGFDPVNAQLIAKEIIELKEKGATVIFSTHRMESVEEMCDHVALIHQSKKILDGTLTDLQQKFKSNIYEIGLKVSNPEEAKQLLNKKYTLVEGDFKSLSTNLNLNVQLSATTTPNEFLKDLFSLGEIAHFVDKIPTMNEIFMKAVSKNNTL